jgi:uncharacterized protein DUF4386
VTIAVAKGAASQSRARLAGALYMISGVPAGFSVWVFSRLVVRGDPGTTAARILASEGLFRLGFVADLVGILFYIGAMLLLFEMFRATNRRLALLLLVLCLIGAGIQALDSLQDVAALLLLKGGPGISGLPAEHARAMAFVFLRLHALSYDLALVFYGSGSIVMSFLLYRSTFLPRILAPLMAIDGAGYLIFALATFLSPPLAARFYPFLPFSTALVGELPMMLWLLLKGVNPERWEEQAASASPGMTPRFETSH